MAVQYTNSLRNSDIWKRQEAIHELITTEKLYLSDLKIIVDVCILHLNIVSNTDSYFSSS